MQFVMNTRVKKVPLSGLNDGVGDYIEVFAAFSDGSESVAPKKFPCVKALHGPAGLVTLIPSTDIAERLAMAFMLDQTLDSVGQWPRLERTQ